MTLTDQQSEICLWIQFLVSSISLFCTLLTLYLIYDLKKRNGYVLLLVSLCVCQCLYNVGYIMNRGSKYGPMCEVRVVICIIGGLSVAIWTNIISFIVLYVIKYLVFIDIVGLYPMFFLVACGFPIILTMYNFPYEYHSQCSDESYGEVLATNVGEIYFYARLVSCALNIIVYGWTYTLSEMRRSWTNAGDDVHGLVHRLKYYALVQGISRIGSSVSEALDRKYFIPELILSVCSPGTGIAYFAVFLYCQPKAWRRLRDYYHSLLACFTNCTVIAEQEAVYCAPLLKDSSHLVDSMLDDGLLNDEASFDSSLYPWSATGGSSSSDSPETIQTIYTLDTRPNDDNDDAPCQTGV